MAGLRRAFLFFIAALACLVSPETLWAAAAPLRIVSLKPNITDILLRLSVREELVGVTSYCTVPPELAQVPKVADYIVPNVEKIAALAPTLVIASKENSAQKPVSRLQALGFRVEFVDIHSASDLYTAIEQIGAWTGREGESTRLIRDLKQELVALEAEGRALQARLGPQRILFVVGQKPLVAAGGAAFFQEFFERLGLQNVLAENRWPYPQLDKETLLALNPDWIIDVSENAPQDAGLSFYARELPELRAVKNNRVRFLPAAQFIPGPILFQGLRAMLSALSETP